MRRKWTELHDAPLKWVRIEKRDCGEGSESSPVGVHKEIEGRIASSWFVSVRRENWVERSVSWSNRDRTGALSFVLSFTVFAYLSPSVHRRIFSPKSFYQSTLPYRLNTTIANDTFYLTNSTWLRYKLWKKAPEPFFSKFNRPRYNESLAILEQLNNLVNNSAREASTLFYQY